MKQTTNYNLVKPELTDSPPDITVMNPNWDTIDEKLREFEEENENIGDLSQLQTTEKSNIVNSINEVFQSVSDGKTLVAGAITDKGVNTSPTATFQTIADNIEAIETDPSIGTTDATAADILSGKKAVSQGQLRTGTMPNHGAVNQNLTSEGQEYTIPSGYHSGLGKVKATITGLVASVIKAGTTVGGILGTFTSDATAAAADILSGKSAYVNGNKVNGGMVDRGTINQTLTQQGQQYTIAAGKHSGSGKVTANFANLVAGNVKNGVNIGGVVGNYVTGIKRVLMVTQVSPITLSPPCIPSNCLTFLIPKNDNVRVLNRINLTTNEFSIITSEDSEQCYVFAYLIEFAPGVIKSKQSLTITEGATAAYTINAVDIDKSIIVPKSICDDSSNETALLTNARFDSPTQITAGGSAGRYNYNIDIVEFY